MIFPTDFKGEIAAISARVRAESLGQKVCVLDPFGITPPWVEPYVKQFNPMALLKSDSDTLISDAGLIADGLIDTPQSGDLHWARREKMLVKRVIVHVAVYGELKGKRNLITVNKLLNSDRKTLMGDLRLSFVEQQEKENEKIADLLNAGAIDLRDSSDTELANVGLNCIKVPDVL